MHTKIQKGQKMTEPVNGGAATDDVKDGAAGTDEKQDGGNDVQTQLDEMKAQLEALKKESAGKDKAISKYQKEIESFNLANKTAEEQLEYYKNQTAVLERKETFRQAFKEIGLNPDEFIEIVDEKDAKVQAEKFAKLIKNRTDESAKNALENFKAEELKKKGGVPQPTETQTNTHADVNAAIRAALGR